MHIGLDSQTLSISNMVSFVIYYHSSRIENLRQTIRFLENRESELISTSEIVLVCQDESESISSKFPIKQFNLNTDTYNKPIMCNHGVRSSTHEIIVLMDSDRILPHNYFTRNTKIATLGKTITTERLFFLEDDYSDIQIESGDIVKTADFKSKTNEMRCKNMFSGNTIFMKQEYFSCGGMDESFVGYGYADNDMTETMKHFGCEEIYLDEEELHLKHARSIYWHGKPLPSKSFVSFSNAKRYLKKWGKEPPAAYQQMESEIRQTLTIL